MKVNHEIILSFNPCKSSYDNFKNKYPNFNGTLEKLLMLEDIPYDDKIWLACKMLNEKTLQQWSVECSYMVLDNFERLFPEDKRVRDCLETVTKVINGELDRSAADSAARSAWSAWSAADSAAWSAVKSATDSAAWSAAKSAAESAAWSATKSAAKSASKSTESAWSAAENVQEDLNLSILIALVSNL